MTTTAYRTREEWSEARKAGQLAPNWEIGASDVGTILGVGYEGAGPWSLWAARHPELYKGDAPKPFAGSIVTESGLRAEPYMADRYRWLRKATVKRRTCRVAHPMYPWAVVSPDGLVGKVGGLEIKAPMRWAGWARQDTEVRSPADALDLAPSRVIAQIYYTLAVTGRDWWDLIIGLDFHTTPIVRFCANPAYQKRLMATVSEWRLRHLVLGEEPPPDVSAPCWQHERGRYEREGVREATSAEIEIAREYAAARVAEAEAKDTKARARIALAESMGPAKKLTAGKVGSVSIGKSLTVRGFNDNGGNQ